MAEADANDGRLRESGQLGDYEHEYDFMVMGCTFRGMLHASYPALPGEVNTWCVQGYVNQFLHKGKLNLTRT